MSASYKDDEAVLKELKAERDRAEAVLKRLGVEPWGTASIYFWMVPFLEAVADRIEFLQGFTDGQSHRIDALEAQLDHLQDRLHNLEMKVEGKR